MERASIRSSPRNRMTGGSGWDSSEWKNGLSSWAERSRSSHEMASARPSSPRSRSTAGWPQALARTKRENMHQAVEETLVDNLAGTRIRVLLADDHGVVRAGLRALLEAQPDITVIAEAP